jgi:hypothetical protein
MPCNWHLPALYIVMDLAIKHPPAEPGDLLTDW